ncbi:hypothetical protein Cs7R123_11850 [Catellatospora sp. TT07R-123]|uniref:hypothetical protein n=1 Tax=Catellatospora sp. TT07R-123 TaxID=2733863 RepID=UPI001B02CFA7|nr:hypothetical protein [Catellatospora sp. TT07R-123]GHJ43843.1 hypothetical protein Cs7R123_11850 [Catellatospora sp. TT07R-123]
MRKLNPHDLDRLVRSNRRLKLSLLITLAAIVLVAVVLIKNDIDARLGAGVGVLIGLLLLMPQRRLLAELGLTGAEAKEILAAHREQLSGVADLPPQERARREGVKATVYILLGLALLAVLAVSAVYFFGHAFETVEEDAPSDPWLGISFFAGFISLCAGPALLWQGSQHRAEAQMWQQRG